MLMGNTNQRHAIPWTDVLIDDPFWTPRLETLVAHTLPSQWSQLHDAGRLALLGIWDGEGKAPPTHRFYDSDIAKWLEAVAYAQAWHPDAGLRSKADRIIAGYEVIQQPDGYCNQSFLDDPDGRWGNLRDDHELYCAGHLMEAAVAWKQAVGDDRLLHVAKRFAEHIWKRFGPDGEPGIPGHPEIELALIRLAVATDEPRWRTLARLFIDRRGRAPHWFEREARARGETPDSRWGRSYHQAGRPVRDIDTIEGHAVRALYLLAGMVDLGNDDPTLAQAAEAWWRNTIERRMYITGAFGSHHEGEIFTSDFDLPNREAYAETCASIAGALVARRMLSRDPAGRDGDVLERCLFNGMLAGLSIDGEHYYYANPLLVQPGIDNFHKGYQAPDAIAIERQRWYGCCCCPSNIARVMASLGGYVADVDENGLDLHLPIGCRIDHGGWRVRVEGDYAWQGRISVRVDDAPADKQRLRLRLPAWRQTSEIALSGHAVEFSEEDGYAVLIREWAPGDRIDADFGIGARRCYADPHISDDACRVAVQRGPLVYCLEQCDHSTDLFRLRLPDEATFSEAPCDLVPGAVALRAEGRTLAADALYGFREPEAETCELRFVPFPLWGNREVSAMEVWVPRDA